MNSFSSFLIVALFKIVSVLPLSVAQFLGRCCGLMLSFGNSVSKRVTQENIHLCFAELTQQQRDELVQQRLVNLGMMVMELPYVWHRPVPQVLARIKRVTGEELISEPLSRGEGVLLLAPHLGNWEVLGLYLGQKYQLTSMFQPPDNPALNQMILTSRARSGSTLVPTNTAGVKAQLKALKKGEMVAILPDQTPPRGRGVYAPFFNIPAYTANLSFNLNRRAKAKVVAAYAKRLTGGEFEIVIVPAQEDIYSDDELVALTALNQTVEDCVRAIPEQYQWEYKRFRRQPDGNKQFYRKKK